MPPAPTHKSLQELEANDRGAPSDAPTNLVERAPTLRRVPLNQLAPGDIRLLLGQDIGTRFLAPLALDLIDPDPWFDAGNYQGDLLLALLRLPPLFWRSNPAARNRLLALSDRAAANPPLDGEPPHQWLDDATVTTRHQIVHAAAALRDA